MILRTLPDRNDSELSLVTFRAENTANNVPEEYRFRTALMLLRFLGSGQSLIQPVQKICKDLRHRIPEIWPQNEIAFHFRQMPG